MAATNRRCACQPVARDWHNWRDMSRKQRYCCPIIIFKLNLFQVDHPNKYGNLCREKAPQAGAVGTAREGLAQLEGHVWKGTTLLPKTPSARKGAPIAAGVVIAITDLGLSGGWALISKHQVCLATRLDPALSQYDNDSNNNQGAVLSTIAPITGLPGG